MSGIYCIRANNAIVYVGKAVDVNDRLKHHFTDIKRSNENKYQLLRKCGKSQLTFWLLEQDIEPEKLFEREKVWINLLNPCLNSMHNNNRGKTITANEFYNIITNQADYVEGMQPYTYIRYGGKK